MKKIILLDDKYSLSNSGDETTRFINEGMIPVFLNENLKGRNLRLYKYVITYLGFEKVEPKVEVFSRKECIFTYCPNPEHCSKLCKSPIKA